MNEEIKQGVYVTVNGDLFVVYDEYIYVDGTVDYSLEGLNFFLYTESHLVYFMCKNAEYIGEL